MPSPPVSGAALIHAAALTNKPSRRLVLLREAESKRRHRRAGQRRRAAPGRRRGKALRHDRRLHGDPREGQGRTGRLRVPQRGRLRDRGAGRDPENREKCSRRAGLRRLPRSRKTARSSRSSKGICRRCRRSRCPPAFPSASTRADDIRPRQALTEAQAKTKRFGDIFRQ